MLQSFLQALSLNVFVFDASHWPPRNASFPGDLTGSFVCPWCALLTEHQIIDCVNVLSSTWCARSATARLSICCAGFSQFFKKIIQTVQKRHPFCGNSLINFSTIAFQYMQVMYKNPIIFTVKHDELMQIIYAVVCYHANKQKILFWFSVLESTNSVNYAEDGKFIQVSVCQKLST